MQTNVTLALRLAVSGIAAVTLMLVVSTTTPADPLIMKGDVIAVCGDSLTEQKIYSVDIEEYLLMCQPVPGIKTLECGWGGSTAPHLASHMVSDYLTFRPDIATTQFGMNDGDYNVVNDTISNNYRSGLIKAIETFKKGGVRTVIVGSPGAVDSTYFHNPRHAGVAASDYNHTLGQLSAIGKAVAAAEGVLFADIHTPLMAAMAASKAKYGDSYSVCGDVDGVHGGPNEHLIMAYALLKAMGFDGNIGTITYDASTGSATGSQGHRIVSSSAGQIVVESSRYPFCFFAGNKDPDKANAVVNPTGNWNYGDAAILSFVPFNQDLNRFTLVVKSLGAPRARVTWGDQSSEFSASDLAGGINLAAAFLKNPFTTQFFAVERVIQSKQDFETSFIKNFLPNETYYLSTVPGKADAIHQIDAGFRDLHDGILDRCAKAVKPITHTIIIEAIR